MHPATVFLTLAAATASPVMAQTPATPTQPGAKSNKADDTIICRLVNFTGSRLSRDRECKTRAEWDRESEAARDDIEDQTKRATGVPLDPETGQVPRPH